LITNIAEQFDDFSFRKQLMLFFPKSVLVTDIAEFSTEAKHMHDAHVWIKYVLKIL